MYQFSNSRTGETIDISQASLCRAQALLEGDGSGACSAAQLLPTGANWPLERLVHSFAMS